MIEFDTHDPMRNCALTFCRYKTTVGLHKLPDTSSPLCLAQFWGHRRTRCGVAAEDSTCSHIFRILWKINKFPLTPIAQIEERTIGHTFCLDPRQLAAVLACFVTNNIRSAVEEISELPLQIGVALHFISSLLAWLMCKSGLGRFGCLG